MKPPMTALFIKILFFALLAYAVLVVLLFVFQRQLMYFPQRQKDDFRPAGFSKRL